MELGLTPGRYVVLVDRDGRLREATFSVEDAGMVRLSSLAFTDVPGEVARARGDAPEPVYTDVPYSLALTPRVSYHFPADEDRQHAQFSLTVGDADRVVGTQQSLLVSHARDGLVGDQFAVGANLSGGPVDGVQSSVVANQSSGRVRGLQLTGGLNLARDGFTGVQVALGGSASGGESRGVQVGAVGVADGLDGVQIAGVGVADELDGVQLAGVTVAKHVRGAQIGLVNVAKEVEGTQIGLVNVSRDVNGDPVGLINLSRTGYNHVRVWVDAAGMGSAGVTFGGKHVYTLISAGAHVSDPAALWTLQAGLGGHARLAGPVSLDVEASVGNLGLGWQPDGDRTIVGLLGRSRALVGVDVAKHVGVFLGPTFDVVMAPGVEPLPTPAWIPTGYLALWGDAPAPWQVGLAAGVRI